MLRRTFSFLLALLLAACPLTCRAIELFGRVGAAAESTGCGACGCCSQGKGERPSGGDRNRGPLPACPCQDDGRDCICGGALVVDTVVSTHPPLPPSLDWLADFSNMGPGAVRAGNERSRSDGHLLAVNGRGLRTLISSWRC